MSSWPHNNHPSPSWPFRTPWFSSDHNNRRNQSLLGEPPWEPVPDFAAPGLNWNDEMLETQSDQRPVAAQARPDPMLPSDLLSPSSNPPVSTSPTAPFGRIEDAALSRLFSPLNASFTGTGFNGMSFIVCLVLSM